MHFGSIKIEYIIPMSNVKRVIRYYKKARINLAACKEEVAMEHSVQSDLVKIIEYTIEVLGDEYVDDVFGGVMSLMDFSYFVYFEYCSRVFINTETKKSVNRHCKEFLDNHSKSYLLREECDEDEKSDELPWHSRKNDESYHKSVLRYIAKMLSNRTILEVDQNNVCARALTELLTFDGTNRPAVRTGMPIGKGYFFQALTESVFLQSKGKVYNWLSNKKTRTEDIAKFYEKNYGFLSEYMMGEYKADLGQDEIDTYIAQAINLVKLEDRRKLGTILDYAIALEQRKPMYFEDGNTNDLQYRFCDIPPLFFCAIAPWERKVKCPNKVLIDIFRWFGWEIGHIYQSCIYASPVLCYRKYINFFINADENLRNIEEYRYYTIIVMAEFVKRKINDGEIRLEYSAPKFARFFHSHYNIFKFYNNRMKSPSDLITKRVAGKIRTITARMVAAE